MQVHNWLMKSTCEKILQSNIPNLFTNSGKAQCEDINLSCFPHIMVLTESKINL